MKMQGVNIELFSNNKWEILKEIAEKQQTPTELAKRTNTSISNIVQQLKILEAYNIIKKEKLTDNKIDTKKVGKPKSKYSLNTSFGYVIFVSEGRAEKKQFKLDGFIGLLFSTLITVPNEDVPFLIRFQLKHEEILKKCKAIGFLKSAKDSIELFLITDHVDEIRAKFSNIFIDDGYGKTKKIINWTHNEYEINDGLNRKDKYFMDMLKNVQILFDFHGSLKKYKEIREKIG